MNILDKEILRSLCRLKVIQARDTVGSLFEIDRTAFRHFAGLRKSGLIVAHQHGLPASHSAHRPGYYRLTRDGFEAAIRLFPGEAHLRDGVARARCLSLRNHEHHDGLVHLYKRTVAGTTAAETIRHADQIRYWGDGDLRLKGRTAISTWEIAPDAVFEAIDGSRRILIEFDRSTKSRTRVLKDVSRYLAYGNSAGIPTSSLMYVTATSRRAQSLGESFRLLPRGRLVLASFDVTGAVEALRSSLFKEKQP